MKDFDILSFDGGGSKGVMEMVILQDVMNTVTLLTRDPEKVLKLVNKNNGCMFATSAERCQFSNMIKDIENPVHPVEVFDMIVGTSTGKLFNNLGSEFLS